MAQYTDQLEPQWIHWAREIRAIAQTGLYFTSDENPNINNRIFDQKRYARLLELSADIIANHGDIHKDSLLNSFAMESGYITPKVDVRAAIFEGDEILLVQDSAERSWSMPGGWADINVSPSKMVEREVLEESGIVSKTIKIIGLYEANHDRDPVSVFHAYKIVFLCERTGGDLRGSEETSAVRYFPMKELPEMKGPRSNLEQVMEAYQHHLDPDRLAYFE
jgi:ADP-ribose pyrophosphatase YjhB (NUDIX family)